MLVIKRFGQSWAVEITTGSHVTATRTFDFWSQAAEYAASASLRTGYMVQTF